VANEQDEIGETHIDRGDMINEVGLAGHLNFVKDELADDAIGVRADRR